MLADSFYGLGVGGGGGGGNSFHLPITFANCLDPDQDDRTDPDQDPINLFGTLIVFLNKLILKKNKQMKNYPACKELIEGAGFCASHVFYSFFSSWCWLPGIFCNFGRGPLDLSDWEN